MYDQIGGGFARYSVDRVWLVPHFEKMLYDNALLARAYLHAWQVTGEESFARVCRETLDWALAELRQEEGAFASALDADSEGVEGKFYVWTPAEVREALGDELGAEAIEHFGMTEQGNFEGANIPVRATPDPPHRDELRKRLYEARAQRVWPGLDDKRLTSWNALMVSALADAAAAFDDDVYREAAVTCADFLVTRMRDDEGRLLRTYNRGQARLRAVLEDHAFLLEALLTLYEATFDPRWFHEARALADTILERFSDPENGGFFSTADDHGGLIARRKDIEDNPIPAGQSAAALGLLRLAALTGEHRYEEAALGVVRLLHAIAPQHPAGVRPPPAGDRLPRLPRARGRARRPGPRGARAGRARQLPPADRAGGRRGGRRAAAGRPRAGRRPRRRLRLRALRLPAPGDRAGRARRAARLRRRSKRNPGSVQSAEMARFLTIPSGRTAKFVVLAAWIVVMVCVFGFNLPGKYTDAEKNESTSFLPGDAESTKALQAVEELQGGEQAPTVVVYRREGGLNAADARTIAEDKRNFNQLREEKAAAGEAPFKATTPLSGPVPSRDGTAALLTMTITGDGETDTLLDPIDALRAEASNPGGGLEAKVTGPGGFSADAVKVFESINGTLFLAAFSLVIVLLILIYRSPIFWLIPVIAVGFAELSARGVGYALSELGVTINGQSSSILSVLVLGAGTDYALLLVSRYREELRKHEDKHEALALALRTAGPAILASGCTVIFALLTLSLAEVNAHVRPRADRRGRHRDGDDLDAHAAPRHAGDHGPARLLAPVYLRLGQRHPAPGRRGRRRDPRRLAPGRRARGEAPAPRVDHDGAAAPGVRRRRAQPRGGPDAEQRLPREGRGGRGPGAARQVVPERRQRAG